MQGLGTGFRVDLRLVLEKWLVITGLQKG